MLYLNHAGTSYPKPPEVREAIRKTLELSPHLWGRAYEDALSSVQKEFREGDLRITSGCTASLALALGDYPWAEGDVLVTSSMEHHALARLVPGLELHRGIIHHTLPYVEGQLVDLERLKERLKRGNVRLVALTAASNVTGERAPLGEIASLCQAHGTRLLVDAAQTFGTAAFREVSESADIIVAAGHKYALGPQGVGVLYARPAVEFASPAAICEVGEQSCSTFPGFCDAGSVNLAGLVGLAAGLAWSRQAGRSEIAAGTHALANEVRQVLCRMSEVKLLGASSLDDGHAVVSFVPTSHPLDSLEAGLRDAGVQVRVGTHCAPQALESLGAPDGCVRVSFGASNDERDATQFLAALREVLAGS